MLGIFGGMFDTVSGSDENWKELYIENKEIIGDSLMDGLVVGTKLTLPESWVKNSSYNIVTLEGNT